MPILKREPARYPEDLFDEDYQSRLQSEGSRWWAVYTLSKKEKEFMRRLTPRLVPFYCPIIGKTYRSPQGRNRTSHIPLFPNYVFIFANEDQRTAAFTTNCVSKCLEVKEQNRLWRDLRQIESLIVVDTPMTPEARLVPGEVVRVKSGPFKGAEGVVFQRQSQSRLLIQVDFLQAGASIQIKDWDLERV